MRIALVSDIHANGIALDAVLDDIAGTGVDEIVCLGDVATLGPHPKRALETLAATPARCVAGNHDDYLLHPGLVENYTDEPLVVASVLWCREQLGPDHLDYVAGFVPELEIDLGGGLTLLAVHGSPRSNTDDVLATTPADELERMLVGRTETADVIASGHTHVQMLRRHGETLLANPGSVGMPFAHHTGGGPPRFLRHAEYGLLDAADGVVTVSLRRLPYDTAAVADAATASGLPMRDYLASQFR